MKSREIDQIFEDSMSRVTVACDDLHSHTALKGCLRGDPRDVTICKLCEVIKKDREELARIVKQQ